MKEENLETAFGVGCIAFVLGGILAVILPLIIALWKLVL